jgi:hypothetical protein
VKILLIQYSLIFLVSCGNNPATTPTKITEHLTEMENATKIDSKPNATISYQALPFKTLNGFRILKKRPPSPFDTNTVTETNEEINEQVNKQVPEEIKKLDASNVEISGFAFPLKLAQGKTNNLILMSVVPSCCYGDVLKISDIIYVTSQNNSINIKENQYIRIKGKLNVGMKQTEDKTSRFLYWLTADEIEIETRAK